MSEKKRRAGATAAGAASSSKKPRAAASYAESLRSKLRPDASILATLRSLASASASSSKSKAAGKSLADHDPSAEPTSSYIVVADQDSSSVTSRINRLVLAAARSILSALAEASPSRCPLPAP